MTSPALPAARWVALSLALCAVALAPGACEQREPESILPVERQVFAHGMAFDELEPLLPVLARYHCVLVFSWPLEGPLDALRAFADAAGKAGVHLIVEPMPGIEAGAAGLNVRTASAYTAGLTPLLHELATLPALTGISLRLSPLEEVWTAVTDSLSRGDFAGATLALRTNGVDEDTLSRGRMMMNGLATSCLDAGLPVWLQVPWLVGEEVLLGQSRAGLQDGLGVPLMTMPERCTLCVNYDRDSFKSTLATIGGTDTFTNYAAYSYAVGLGGSLRWPTALAIGGLGGDQGRFREDIAAALGAKLSFADISLASIEQLDSKSDLETRIAIGLISPEIPYFDPDAFVARLRLQEWIASITPS